MKEIRNREIVLERQREIYILRKIQRYKDTYRERLREIQRYRDRYRYIDRFRWID